MILAGISIVALTGDNSVVKQATEAQIMTELSNVKEALEIYKIRNHSDGDMSDEELVEEGLLKEVFVNDTYRTLAIITDLKTIEVSGKLGKTGAKQEQKEVDTLLDLYDVYVVDMIDGSLYYIRNGIWSVDGNKTTYTSESGEEKEGYTVETINQQYLEDRKFITEWTVEAGTTITLPITKESNITIEWGSDDNEDGELDVEQCTAIQPTHTYTEAGTYTIKIAGIMHNWSFKDVDISKDYITGLKQWGNIEIQVINFSSCSNLQGTIPNHKTEGEFKELKSAGDLFYECIKITGSIPKDLFSGAKGMVWYGFDRCFTNCSSLTGNIPQDLFKDCVNVTSFVEVFSGCTGLTGTIPENLFANNVKARNLNFAFQDCTGIIGIPQGLFRNNTEISNLYWVFGGCSGITEIPEGLFENCSKITNLCLAFRYTSIKEIPVDIFDINNGEPNGILDLAGTFEGTQIKEVPEGLFDLCTEVTAFGRDWSYAGIFQNCKLLETIPDKLFYKNTKVTGFGNAFNGCEKLKEIPENIFNIQQENVSMWYAFCNCKLLNKISGGIFQNVPNIINLCSTFQGCINLEEVGEGFTISDKTTNMRNTFLECRKLSKFPDKIVIPESVVDIVGTFNGCNQLKTTILLTTNSAKYGLTFYGVNADARVNWTLTCTEDYVDEALTNSYNTKIKGVQE